MDSTTNKEETEEKSRSVTWKWPLSLSRRYLIAWLCFWGCFNLYTLRGNLSFAIVPMTANRTIVDENGTLSYVQDFNWNSKEQGLLLGSFFYGYITSQILAGYIVPWVGSVRLLCLSIAGTAVLTVLTPIVAVAGYIPLILLRVLEGILEGLAFPCFNDLWNFWAPVYERTKLFSISYAGNQMGSCVTMLISGIIADHLGWPWIFYTFGVFGILWGIVWLAVVRDKPADDKYITQEELQYIQSSLGRVEKRKNSEIPWKTILTSKHIWASMIAHVVQNSGMYTLITQLPTFLNDVSGWSLSKMGYLAALPYITLALTIPISGHLADYLRGKRHISTTLVRKSFTSGAYVVQMSFLLATAYSTSGEMAILFLTIAIGAGGFAAYNVNYMDLAPSYASLTYGISNTLATVPGMISPVITGYIVQNKLPSEWYIVFYTTASVYFIGAVVFAIFASGEQQPWAQTTSTRKEDNQDNP